MKILSREQIRNADAYTIENEPIQSIDLMERAATAFTKSLIKLINKKNRINIFCGKGNNGGDGLVAARLLTQKGYEVRTFIVHYSDKSSRDFDINLERLKQINDTMILDIHQEGDFPELTAKDLIIDGLWGTGLSRPVKGFGRDIILKMNESPADIIALDIPSGSFCDGFNNDEAKVKAASTISFQPPKLSFFMPENETYMGNWKFVDIGLDRDFISSQDSNFHYAYPEEVRSLFKTRKAFDHKGKFGHALIISGSYGKIGASVLASKACLRIGAGLVSAYIPKCGYQVYQTALPEAMVMTDEENELITQIPELSIFNAIGTGPGIGTHKRTEYALTKLFKTAKAPLVIDADGINLMAKNPVLLDRLPKNSILTPHIGEFDRLTGKSKDHWERLEKARHFAQKHQVVVLLKGKYSAICNASGEVYFNSTGNPGMATGGSGDVLTGIVTGMLAQGYNSFEAALLGAYVHGLAGDLAVKKLGQHGMIAGDLVEFLPKAMKKCTHEK